MLWGGTYLPDDTKNGSEADWQVTAILKLSMKCNKAQFKRQKFSCNELFGQPKWDRFNSNVDLGVKHFQILPTGSWRKFLKVSLKILYGYQGANIGLFFNLQGSFCHLSLVVVPSCRSLSPGQTRYYLMDWGWHTKIIQQAQL